MGRTRRWVVVLVGVVAGHLLVLSLMTLRGHEPAPGSEPDPIAVTLVTLQPPRPSPLRRARRPISPSPRPGLRPIRPHLTLAPDPAVGAVATTPGAEDLMAAPFARGGGPPRLRLGLPACDPGGVFPANSGHKPCPKAPDVPPADLDADPANSGFAVEARRKAAMRDYRDHLGSPYPGLLCAIGHRCK